MVVSINNLTVGFAGEKKVELRHLGALVKTEYRNEGVQRIG